MYVLETDSREAVESIYVIEVIEIIKAYVLETDPHSGCIKHVRNEKCKSLCAKGRPMCGCKEHVKGYKHPRISILYAINIFIYIY